MMNAKEARKLSENAKKNVIAKEYEKLIKEAAENGDFSVTVDRFLDDFTTNILKDLGYNVKECDEGGWTQISW